MKGSTNEKLREIITTFDEGIKELRAEVRSCLGRQYRWYNGYIQTRTKTGKWHRTINIPTTMLETCEVDDNEIL